MNPARFSHPLHTLARLFGVHTSYRDLSKRKQFAEVDSLLLVLREMGSDLSRLSDVPRAIEERRETLWQCLIEPVLVAWEGMLAPVSVRFPIELSDGVLQFSIQYEDGNSKMWQQDLGKLPIIGKEELTGQTYVCKRLYFKQRLPLGYHQLTTTLHERIYQTLILAAPRQTFVPDASSVEQKHWGVFSPLYALSSIEGWGQGDFSDLATGLHWLEQREGQFLATLPLLAAFLDEPFDPSPYTPVSRLFWNELYIDVPSVPEFSSSPEAQQLVAGVSFQETLERLRQERLVDYKAAMALKRKVLELLSQAFTQRASSDRKAAFQQFVSQQPSIEAYASFRATCERQRLPWHQWPSAMKDGSLSEGAFDKSAQRYHLYVQWLSHEQLWKLSHTSEGKFSKVRLALDLPLGVHPDGFDVWQKQELFLRRMSVGAPPDIVFTHGQDWGFPPMHPERIREEGYRYYRACVRHHLQHAGLLRMDHVMGLHRLFWVPQGRSAKQGVYVTYHAEEFYAILSLESHRAQAIIVGEDLGTVPPEVPRAMAAHRLHQLFVVEYELAANTTRKLTHVPRDAVAALNTHDMPPFAAFWEGQDIEERMTMGLLHDSEVPKERAQRRRMTKALVRFLYRSGWIKKSKDIPQGLEVLRACLFHLAQSPARVVIVNLEDLLWEIKPQNIPSTIDQYPNWRRKTREPVESIFQMPELIEVAQEIHRLRQAKSAVKPHPLPSLLSIQPVRG